MSNAPSDWHNPIPTWITTDSKFLELRQGPKHTLQTIANLGTAQISGDITSCYGGNNLIQAAGCNRATIWRHIRLLTDLGYITTTTHGRSRPTRNDANIYSIPGQQVVANCNGGSRKLRHHHPGLIPDTGISTEPPGVPGRGSRNLRLPTLTNILIDDLTDINRLRQLHKLAIDKSWATDSDHGRLTFVSLAERALRIGTNPPALFAYSLQHHLAKFITQADESNAQIRIKARRDQLNLFDDDD